jgi:hypothetical protein
MFAQSSELQPETVSGHGYRVSQKLNLHPRAETLTTFAPSERERPAMATKTARLQRAATGKMQAATHGTTAVNAKSAYLYRSARFRLVAIVVHLRALVVRMLQPPPPLRICRPPHRGSLSVAELLPSDLHYSSPAWSATPSPIATILGASETSCRLKRASRPTLFARAARPRRHTSVSPSERASEGTSAPHSLFVSSQYLSTSFSSMGTRPVSDDGGGVQAANPASPPAGSTSAVKPAPASAPTNASVHLQRLSNSQQPHSQPPQQRAAPRSSKSVGATSAGRVASARVGGARRRAETDNHSHMRASLPPTLSSGVVLDRRLLQKYEQVNQEIERIVRASQMDFAAPGADGASASQVKSELKQAKKSSSQMIHAQKELLDKMEKQERGGLRRVFTLNKAAKMAKLRSKLCDKLSESVQVDEELQRLERQSTALSATALGTITQSGTAVVNVSNVHSAAGNSFANSNNFSSSFANTSTSVFSMSVNGLSSLDETRDVSGSESSGPVPTMRMSSGWEDAQEELLMLEREKEDILNDLFQTVDMPAVLDLHARIASFSSEIKAVASVKKQSDRVEEMYRKALHLLRVALAAVVSPNYSGSIREFAVSSYPLAVEAGHLIEQACHVIQPEAQRKYEAFASELTHVRPPKFPQPVSDFARRSRTHYDPHSALSIEGMRNLHAAENVLILLQRLVIQKLEGVEKWQAKLAKDQEAAESAHAQMETRLQEQVAVLARSVSV